MCQKTAEKGFNWARQGSFLWGISKALKCPALWLSFLVQGKAYHRCPRGFETELWDLTIPIGRKTKDGFTFHNLSHAAKILIRKAGVDKNVRAVIFVHNVSSDTDSRYDHVDESDLLAAIGRTDEFLESVSQNVSQAAKNS